MTSRQTEEIKNRLNIVDLIQSYIRLEKAGINFRGRCPFHQERTPSFFVSPVRQTWRCFGCQKGGDHFSFVQEIENVDFLEALKILANRAGVKLEREDPKTVSERARLLAICETTAEFFYANLQNSPNPNRKNPIMRYLAERGVTEKTITDFRIGYAPDSWDSLYTHLSRKGFKDAEIEKAGLIIKKENTRPGERHYYDRYRNRVIFPIADVSGRIIAFGGRIFPTAVKTNETMEAKYINSPETPLYNKSHILYGFHKAKNAIREKNECVIVEGYMDAVMSHQAGAINTVAVSGTALTEEQLKILTRLAHSVIFAFDMDAAGQNAAKRSLELAATANIERKILLLPAGKDPADAARENPDTLINAVKNAKSVMEYYFLETSKRFNINNPEDKKNAAIFFLPQVKNLANEIERSHWIQKFSELISIPENSIRTELEKLRKSPSEKYTPVAPALARTRRKMLEERLLSLLVEDPQKFKKAESEFPESIPFTILAHERLFKEFHQQKNSDTVSPEIKNLLERLRFERETMNYTTVNIAEEAVLAARGILQEHYKEKMQDLHAQIKNLEKSQNQDKIKNLLEDFNQSAKKVKLYS